MSKHTYEHLDTECDWCEENKTCRYLYQDDVPVLAICEDCDGTEFTAITKEEENVMNTNIICEVKGCQNTGKFHMLVWALNFNAYALDMLPSEYQGAGWQETEMDFCGTHKNVLHRGKAVELKLAVTPVVSYNLTVPEQRDLFSVEVLGQDPIHIEDHYNGDTTKEEEMNKFMNINQSQMDVLMKRVDLSKVHQLLDPTRQNLIQVKSTPATDPLDPARLGYVYNGSDYMGYFAMNKGQFVLVANRGDRFDVYSWKEFFSNRELNTEHDIPGGTPGRGHRIQKSAGNDRYKEWHGSRKHADAHVKALIEEKFLGVKLFPASNDHGYWVYWSIVKAPAKTTVPVENKGVLCGNCKEFHPTPADVKACYATRKS